MGTTKRNSRTNADGVRHFEARHLGDLRHRPHTRAAHQQRSVSCNSPTTHMGLSSRLSVECPPSGPGLLASWNESDRLVGSCACPVGAVSGGASDVGGACSGSCLSAASIVIA